MTMHIDMTTRKTAAFPSDIRARIAEVLASHSGIARPEGIGRRVAMPTKPSS
jgi:acyl-CoA thioester hydrolase